LKVKLTKILGDVILEFPKSSILDKKDWHYLAYIPWNEKYLNKIPKEFVDFFKFVFPYLNVRTTDVHTAICLGFLDKLIKQFPKENINRRIVAIALILHDSGWSKLSDQEIASSLGIKGLKLDKLSTKSKEKHAVEGEKIARKLLGEEDGDKNDDDSLVGFEFNPKLTAQEKEIIFRAVRYHDKPDKVVGFGNMVPIEVKLLVDLDHLWSFTHENFWQDIFRKGVEPQEYLQNLDNDLESYFVTDPGKTLARKFLFDRKKEVIQL